MLASLFLIFIIYWVLFPNPTLSGNSNKNDKTTNFDYLLPPSTQEWLEEQEKNFY